MKPLLLVLAGPNGSGKSTLCATPDFAAMLKQNNATIINPDEIAKLAPIGANPLIWSGRTVHQAIAQRIKSRASFLIETTLSGRNHFRTVEEAKEAGYHVSLHFVFVSSLAQSKERVKLRVETGGHDVSEIDQERRYEKSLSNFAQMLPVTDEAFVYRNDYNMGHERIAEYLLGTCMWIDEAAPQWVPRASLSKFS